MLDFLILLPGIPIGIRHQPVYFPIIEQPFFSVCFSQDCFCQGNDFPLPVWGRRNWYLLQISAQDFQGMELPAVKELGGAGIQDSHNVFHVHTGHMGNQDIAAI